MMANFEEKLQASMNLVKKALSEHNDPVVACSFGKDSMAVLHLVRQFKPDVKVLWNNTLVEYPDTYQFAHRIIREWNLQIYEAKPQKTFWQVVSELGWPIYPRNTAGIRQKATVRCCKELKKLPTLRLLRYHKWNLYFTGLTRHESRLREYSAQRYGNYFYSKEWRIWKCHPILDWTTDDVWEYHRQFQLPYNPLYDKNEVMVGGGIRTGCWPCPQAIRYGKLQHLRHYYPKLFHFLIVQKGFGKEILNWQLQGGRGQGAAQAATYLDMGIDKALEHEPSLFDKPHIRPPKLLEKAGCLEGYQLNWGKIRNADGVGKAAGVCRDTMEIYIKVENSKIIKAKFTTDGCHGAIACGNTATQLAKGKNIFEALKISPGDILAGVGKIPETEAHCSALAANALHQAIQLALLRNKHLETVPYMAV